MVVPWVLEEMRTADLKDKRLNDRLREVLSQLGGHPTASIPAACGGHAEMTAAYRLFDNDNATFETVLQPHIDTTRQRIASHPVVLVVQDTSEIDVTRPEQQMEGAGPLDGGARWGALLHPLHAFTPDGTPLGTVHARAWTRDEAGERSRSLSRGQRAATPIEEKESYRWVEAFRRAGEEATHCPSTHLICVADSEADIYELLAEGTTEQHHIDWIVRAAQNRALQRDNDQKTAEKHIRDHLLTQAVLFTHTIQVRGRKALINGETRGRRQPRDSREAEMEVRAAQVTLRPPWRAERKLPAVTVNTVLVREVDPPENDEPVEWLLLTSLPVDEIEQVRLVVQYYCARWMIEVFFKVLKSGCRVEERRFEHIDRFLSCLAVYLIVAWRTLYVCRLGRGCPDISCEAVFEPAEWKSVWKVVHRSTPPNVPPRLGEMVRLVAQLGGYVNRTRNDPPGPQTIWMGMQRMHDFALSWRLFGPDTRAGPQDV
ncbi:MAG: IS4 family transposase [Phycisphaerales bacterium]|nr:MAG: IS4 family transposase [Phycisphaerales bacterium]